MILCQLSPHYRPTRTNLDISHPDFKISNFQIKVVLSKHHLWFNKSKILKSAMCRFVKQSDVTKVMLD